MRHLQDTRHYKTVISRFFSRKENLYRKSRELLSCAVLCLMRLSFRSARQASERGGDYSARVLHLGCKAPSLSQKH